MSKPIPRPNVVTESFWSSCKEGRFEFQICKRCGHKQFPPRLSCVGCHDTNLGWQKSNGLGTVYSYTVVHRAPLEAFKADVPYVTAIVALEEGVRAMVNLRGVEPDDVTIGMPVEIYFEPTEGEYPIPQAAPRKMFLFETFEPGKLIDTRTLMLDRMLMEQWLKAFPADRDGDRMPPGMMAVVYSRAYSSILQPRPPGNVHGQQVFTVTSLPKVGDELVTDLRCESKEMKGEHRWVRFSSQTRRSDGELMFSGSMTTLWAK